jgi:hypothetical protein
LLIKSIHKNALTPFKLRLGTNQIKNKQGNSPKDNFVILKSYFEKFFEKKWRLEPTLKTGRNRKAKRVGTNLKK